MPKFIFVTGGVVSGLGKGITAASLGRLLKERGIKVSAQKLDPYMNIDPGTMSPHEHGEVFVTEDGAETDLDLGHYERFIDENLNKYSNLTSGKVYWNVLNRERVGGYLGQTVQVIPHITNEIKDFVLKASTNTDILITEIGGTTGDIESQPFLEAIRQISLEIPKEDCLFIHVTLVPYLRGSNEHKSKPTQHSVKELRSLGISPDIIIARADEPIPKSIRDKIALFCNVRKECVIENLTLPSLYEAPLMLSENGLDDAICSLLKLDYEKPDLTEWKNLCSMIKNTTKQVNIALVGKYVKLQDAYLSVVESLNHAGYNLSTKVNIKWVDSENVTQQNAKDIFSDVDGIILPGGFGNRGIEGMVATCNYARTNDIPFLGICLGMQISVIEFARNCCNMSEANSSEFANDTKYPVIDLMLTQKDVENMGGTMRLGAYPCKVYEKTKMFEQYGESLIWERHRHRYEVNNKYRDIFTQNGLTISGTSPDGNLVEAIEISANKYYVAGQFHPEFKSRPNKPHPLFIGLIKAATKE